MIQLSHPNRHKHRSANGRFTKTLCAGKVTELMVNSSAVYNSTVGIYADDTTLSSSSDVKTSSTDIPNVLQKDSDGIARIESRVHRSSAVARATESQ